MEPLASRPRGRARAARRILVGLAGAAAAVLATAAPAARLASAPVTLRMAMWSVRKDSWGTAGISTTWKSRVEPAASPVIAQHLKGQKLRPGYHRIQGIGAGFIPPILDRSMIDKVEKVTGDEAFEGFRDSYTKVARGDEFELVLNVSRQLRLMANYSEPRIGASDRYPDTLAYINTNMALFKQIATDAGAAIDANNAMVQSNLGLALLFVRDAAGAEEAARRDRRRDTRPGAARPSARRRRTTA